MFEIKAQHITGIVFTGTLQEDQEKKWVCSFIGQEPLLSFLLPTLTGTLEEALEQLKEHFIDYKISITKIVPEQERNHD